MHSVLKNINSKYYNKDQHYYICSYGGCGSKILVQYLSNFGNAYHIHSKIPPKKLTYIGTINSNKNTYIEWFNDTEIKPELLENYKVIFLYKHPVKAIYSRFIIPEHLKNIQCNTNIKIKDVIDQVKDLYGINTFFYNYTIPVHPKLEQRNYKIYCVKYEDFFDNILYFNQTLELPNDTTLYPIKKETERKMDNEYYILENVYHKLLYKMNNMHFITIV